MITRDQKRARHAYDCVRAVEAKQRDDYKTLVFGLGPSVMRSGLAAALAFVEREKKRTPAAARFLSDLGAADAGLPGLAGSGEELPARVRALDDVETYMLATREVLKLTVWFRRAVQALYREADDAPAHSEAAS
jgi:CRISPR-associated protein Cmr5